MWFGFDHEFSVTTVVLKPSAICKSTFHCQGVSMLGLFCESRQGLSCVKSASNQGV